MRDLIRRLRGSDAKKLRAYVQAVGAAYDAGDMTAVGVLLAFREAL